MSSGPQKKTYTYEGKTWSAVFQEMADHCKKAEEEDVLLEFEMGTLEPTAGFYKRRITAALLEWPARRKK